MNILFIHQNFPAQFVHISAELAKDQRNRVMALSMSELPAPAGVTVRPYTLLRSSVADTHPLLQEQESHVLRAEAAAAAALQLKHEGFVPDLIVAHPGWGEALFMKEVFPQAKLVIYCELYYEQHGQDFGFDPEAPPVTFAQRCKLRLKNTTNLLSLEIADAAISPTEWQKSTYPAWAQEKITVIHDGIDVERLRFNPDARLRLACADGTQLAFKPGDEVLTYVSRNLEPIRGFHVFMRALPEILRCRPDAHVIIVGGDEVGYGYPAPQGRTWKEHMLAEVGGELDLRRVHFLGKVPYQSYVDLLSISRVHVYLTAPFVLSWSFLEAVASGVPVIASDTAPVREYAQRMAIRTVDFFDISDYVSKISNALVTPLPRLPDKFFDELRLKNTLSEQIKFLIHSSQKNN